MFALAVAAAVPPPIEAPVYRSQAPYRVQLDAVPFASLVVMLLRDVVARPFSVAPDVLADRRPMSVRLAIPRDNAAAFVRQYLASQGLNVRELNGTIQVSRQQAGAFGGAAQTYSGGAAMQVAWSGAAGEPSPVETPQLGASPGSGYSPVLAGQAEPFRPGVQTLASGPAVFALYLPAHRQPAYIAEMVLATFPGLSAGARGEVRPAQNGLVIDPQQAPDVLLLSGAADELAAACELVQLLDRPRPMVSVRAVVMQVQNDNKRGSALSFLASFDGGRVEVGSYPFNPVAGQFVRLSAGAIRAAFSAVREDSRFKVVATPNLVALSGAVASLNSGAQVPTVGAVVAGDNGPPVQSVVYRDSGITLSIKPVVRGDVIEMEVREERSTFAKTTTGVENSPTLQRSSVVAQVVVKSGESVALAGLTEKTTSSSNSGILGGLLGVRDKGGAEAELVVVLTAEIVLPPVSLPGVFLKPCPPSSHKPAAAVPVAPPVVGSSTPQRTERSDGGRREVPTT